MVLKDFGEISNMGLGETFCSLMLESLGEVSIQMSLGKRLTFLHCFPSGATAERKLAGSALRVPVGNKAINSNCGSMAGLCRTRDRAGIPTLVDRISGGD